MDFTATDLARVEGKGSVSGRCSGEQVERGECEESPPANYPKAGENALGRRESAQLFMKKRKRCFVLQYILMGRKRSIKADS